MKFLMNDERSGLATVLAESPVHFEYSPLIYVMAVKNAFHEETDKYDEFAEIMLDYGAERIDIQSLKARIKQLLKGHRSLLERFNNYLSEGHQIILPPENDVVDVDDVDIAGGSKKPELDDMRNFIAKLQSRFQGDGSASASVYTSFLQCLSLYAYRKMPREVARRRLAALVCNHPDLQIELTQILPDMHDGSPVENTENNSGTVKLKESSTDMDGNNQRKGVACEPCTPSYRFIVKDCSAPLASRRTANDIEVLNDSWEAVTSGRENRSFKHMRKNKYEYSLLCCDDERFELDMLLETVRGTIMCAEELMKKIDEVSIPIRLEDYFKVRNIRCIERLYGDHGLQMMDILRETPSDALTVILPRLNQKQEEWKKCQVHFNALWTQVFAKNYHKSLDYRGVNFKEQDIKSLSTKALLAEIEKSPGGLKRKDGSAVRSLSDRKEHTVNPQMEFEYPDPNIHDDIYQLIKYSCGAKHLDEVMNIWINFLEPMLGVPPRQYASEKAEELSPEAEESVYRLSDTESESDGENLSHDDVDDEETNDDDQHVEYNQLFYGNNSFYVLFRLHHMLYKRLQAAKLCSSAASMWRMDNDTVSGDRYARFAKALYNLLNGSFDQEEFERECIIILGTESYLLFTLDQWIFRIVKQLHGIATRKIDGKFIQLYSFESFRRSGRLMDKYYYKNARDLVPKKNMFRLEYMPEAARLSIQLMKPQLKKH